MSGAGRPRHGGPAHNDASGPRSVRVGAWLRAACFAERKGEGVVEEAGKAKGVEAAVAAAAALLPPENGPA